MTATCHARRRRALLHLGGGDTGFAGTKDPLITPLNLNADEEALLVVFLKSLTGEAPPAALGVDTAAP